MNKLLDKFYRFWYNPHKKWSKKNYNFLYLHALVDCDWGTLIYLDKLKYGKSNINLKD